MVRVNVRLAASVALVVAVAALARAQSTAPPAPLMLVSREARLPVPTTMAGADELIGLDDVASLFKATVREDSLTGGVTVAYRDRSVALSPGQSMASVNGRVVTLPSPLVRTGGRWLVPVEFLARALALIYDRRIDLRRASRLLVVGDVRVPRVTARLEPAGSSTRATVDVVPATPVTVTTEAGQVLLRVEADLLDLTAPATGSGLITQVRSGDRVVTLGLAPGTGPAKATTTSLPDRTRVVVEVAPIAPTVEAPVSVAPRAPTSQPAAPVAPPRGDDVVVRTVAIDAGHGGDDVGVRGPDGLEEKQITLDVARRLRSLLETRMGLRVIMTRDDDRLVGADDRAAAANAGKADLLMSLHANAAFSPATAGAEVMAQQLDGEAEAERARRVTAALPAVGGATRAVGLLRWDLAQAHQVDDAWTLATMVEAELRQQVPMAARPLRRVHLRMLAGAAMPAVQVEMAYLTNAEQAAQAATDEFKDRIAQALASGIARYAAREAPGP